MEGRRTTAGLFLIDTTAPFRSRERMYKVIWALFGASLVIPADGVPGGLYVLANIVTPDAFPSSRHGMALLPMGVFTFALLSNTAFLVAPSLRYRRTLSPACRGFLLAALVVDAAVVVVMPHFARTLPYWLWLASVGAVVWAVVALPYDAPVSPRRSHLDAAEPGAVPAIIWMWVAFAVFWLAVTGADRRRGDPPPPDPAAIRARALTPHALTGYFTDEAGLFAAEDVARFNRALEQFERETSNQLAVSVLPDRPEGPLENFTIRTADLSRLGRKGLDNGAILFVFAGARTARFEVGYGLEPVLNDAKAGSILESALVPAWRAGEPVQAIDATLSAAFAAIRDAYQAQRMPSRLAVFRRQLAVTIPMLPAMAWPAVRGLALDARVAITFFGSLILFGMWDGVVQTCRLAAAAGRAMRNLSRRRPIGSGIRPMKIESMVDSIKVLIIVAAALAAGVGIVVVAGGGAFGGAGALRSW